MFNQLNLTGETKRKADSGIISERISSRTIIPMQRHLFLPEEIKLSPKHKKFGRASTIFLPDVPPFQGWLIPAYLNNEIENLLSESKNSTRLKNLRSGKKPLVYSWNYTNEDFSNVSAWSDNKVRDKIQELKNNLDWKNTTGSSRKWWNEFESNNQSNPKLILRLCEELFQRNATITEFF